MTTATETEIEQLRAQIDALLHGHSIEVVSNALGLVLANGALIIRADTAQFQDDDGRGVLDVLFGIAKQKLDAQLTVGAMPQGKVFARPD